MLPQECRYFERLIDTYTDNIRAADVKANIVGIMIIWSISVLTSFRQELPGWLPLYIILLLPMSSVFFMILSIFPRFNPTPGLPFRIAASVGPGDFETMPKDDAELEAAYRNDCVGLARILYWKIFCFRAGMTFCFLYLALLFVLAIGGAMIPAPSLPSVGPG